MCAVGYLIPCLQRENFSSWSTYAPSLNINHQFSFFDMSTWSFIWWPHISIIIRSMHSFTLSADHGATLSFELRSYTSVEYVYVVWRSLTPPWGVRRYTHNWENSTWTHIAFQVDESLSSQWPIDSRTCSICGFLY